MAVKPYSDIQHPTLSCDCYPGCWGDHSADWPEIEIPLRLYPAFATACWSQERGFLPYGSHVTMSNRDADVQVVRVNSTERHHQCKLALAAIFAEDIVREELGKATTRFGSFASRHEGLAVIEEEFLELRDEAYWGHKRGLDAEDPEDDHYRRLEEEAKQVAAMAMRFIMDITTPKLGVR